MNRRGFITGAITLLAAPSLVRAASLMPISVQPAPLLIKPDPYPAALEWENGWCEGMILWNRDLAEGHFKRAREALAFYAGRHW